MKYLAGVVIVICCIVNCCFADFFMIINFSDISNYLTHWAYTNILSDSIDGNYVLASSGCCGPFVSVVKQSFVSYNSDGTIIYYSSKFAVISLSVQDDFNEGGNDMWYDLRMDSVDGNVAYFSGTQSVWSNDSIYNNIVVDNFLYQGHFGKYWGAYGGSARIVPPSGNQSVIYDCNTLPEIYLPEFCGKRNFIQFAETPFAEFEDDLNCLAQFVSGWLQSPAKFDASNCQ